MKKWGKRPRVQKAHNKPTAVLADEGLHQRWCLASGIFCVLIALMWSYTFTHRLYSQYLLREYVAIFVCFLSQCWNDDNILCKLCSCVSTILLVLAFIYALFRILHKDFMLI